MTNIKNAFLILLFFSEILVSCARRKDPCPHNPSIRHTYFIQDSNKAIIPYTGNDALVFVSNTNDTAILTGGGINKYFLEYAEKTNSNPECPEYDYWVFERNDYQFKGNNQFLNKIDYNINYGDIHNPTTTQKSGDAIDIHILGTNYSFNFLYISNFQSYTDSINIKGEWVRTKTIYGVSSPLFIVYSLKYGIVKIKTLDKTWIKN